MNRLQIAQELRRKVGAPGTGPTSTANQTGEMLDIVKWADEAWHLIQTLEDDWLWMKRDFTFNTTAGKGFYLPSATAGETGVADWSRWDFDEDFWSVWLTSAGQAREQFLVDWSHKDFRQTYLFGAQATLQGHPQVIAIRDRDRALLLGPLPDTVYTVRGRYVVVPQVLAADGDIPAMPERFHMAIVYRAMMLYGAYEAAQEVYSEGEREFSRMLAALKLDQLDRPTHGEPLA